MGNNIILFNSNNKNHPTLETHIAYFTDNFEPIELKISNSKLKINAKEAKIDSILLLNSSPQTPLHLTILFELSSAINPNDLEFYKKVFEFYSSVSKLLFEKIDFVLIAEKPIFLSESYANKYKFDSLKSFEFTHKSDLNQLLNSPIFLNNQKGNNNAILLITKSLVKLNAKQLINYLSSNQAKFFHINLSDYNYSLYEELCNATNSVSIKLTELKNTEKILKISTYILSQGLYQRFYCSEILKIGKNLIEFDSGDDKDSLVINLYENDFPELEFKDNTYFFGILDSGIRKTITFKVQAKNRAQIITKITTNNPNFRVWNFSPNTKLQPNDELEINIEYKSVSTSFDSSVITLSTNYGRDYQIFAYAGQPKLFTQQDLKYIGFDENSTALTGDLFKLNWVGSHPLDTFLIHYKIKNESNWRLISNNATNNSYNWLVPDLPDTTIQLRISQANKNLISDKVLLLTEHKGKITEVSFSPNDSLLATASEDGYIYLWNAKTGKKEKILFQSQSKIISDIDWSKDGKYLAIAALGTSIKIWSFESDVLYKDISTESKIVNIGFSFDGNYLIARSTDDQVLIWRFPSLEYQGLIQIPFESTYFELNPYYHNFLAISLSGNILVYDYIQLKEISTFPIADYPLLSGSFSPSGNNIVVAGNDNKVRIYDTFSGQNVLTLFDTQSPVISVSWLKNRQFIATSSGHLVKLWSPSDGKLLETYDQHSSAVYYIKSNNKGSYVASVDQNNIIHLWSPFDFPFIKPLAVSLESPEIKIISKKVQTKTYFLSNIQISDTLSIYFEEIGLNKTEKNIIIDTLTISNQPNYINLDEKYSNFLLPQSAKLIGTLNYIPRVIGNNQFNINIKSGYKIFSSQVNVNVLPNILDRKFTVIDFGKVQIGTSKDTSVFILQNISDAPIIIDSIVFFNTNDVELVSLDIPYEIRKIGGVFAPTIRFSPTQVGSVSGFFRVYLNKLLPVDVYFFGEGIAPKLELVEKINDISNLCKEYITFPFILKNSGTANLEIKKIQFEGSLKSEFEVKNYPLLIKPNYIDTIWIRWTPKTFGSNQVWLSIHTNLQSNNQNISQFEFIAINNFLNFDINPNPIIFEPIDDNDQVQKKIIINNSGSINSSVRIVQNPKYFSIDSLQQINSLAILYVRFLGGMQQDFYSDTIKIADDCEKIYKIELLALVKKDQALLTIQDSIGFYLLCEQKAEQKIPIQNYGKTNLTISEIKFAEPTSNLDVFPKELIIPPNSFSYITISFQSPFHQDVTNYLILKSNAINHPQGITKILVRAIKDIISYEFSTDTLNFGDVAQQDSVEKFIYFTNYGTIPIKNYFENFSNIFSVVYSEEANILPNQINKLRIIKNPTNTSGIIVDSLKYLDICGNSRKVILIVNSTQNQPKITISNPYPNPTFNKFNITIQSNFSYILKYELYDYLGKIAKEKNIGQISQNNYYLEIDLSTNSVGIYLLKLFINENENQFKLIKIN